MCRPKEFGVSGDREDFFEKSCFFSEVASEVP